MKNCTDIVFLDTYWKEAKNVAQRITKELPQLNEPQVKSTGKLYFIKFSDITDSWSVKDLLCKLYGKSPNLEVLADKISSMIYKGNADSVKQMLEKICTGRVKNLKQPDLNRSTIDNNGVRTAEKFSETLGKGHFRWNRRAYTLTDAEIKHIKQYFKL